jgi:hypothetical protein
MMIMMNRTLVFDMDGTIANLYGVENWLNLLRAESSLPYRVAEPMYDMDTLVVVLNLLKAQGWKVAVTSWLSMDSTRAYDEKVKVAKREWLAKYNFPYDEIHLVPYGTPKSECTRNLGGFQILFDDNKEVRDGWELGQTVDANGNILEKLVDLLF